VADASVDVVISNGAINLTAHKPVSSGFAGLELVAFTSYKTAAATTGAISARTSGAKFGGQRKR
jgi:hypothetical protein